jgi:S-disulfanyl-L-cysteine oxidoreductase SoxD
MAKSSLLMALAAAGFLSVAGAGAAGSTASQSPRSIERHFPTVWSGVYSKADAEQGKQAYAQLCSRCHGADMKGGLTAPAIVGSRFFDRWHDFRLGDVVAYIQAAMPREHEFYVPADSARAIVGLILQQSGVPPGNEPMSTDIKVQRDILITRPPLRK